MNPTIRELTIVGSGTALEKEYAAVCTALARCSAPKASFDPSGFDPKAIESARGMWLDRMEFEHRSTTVFSQLAAQLIEANATLDAKVCMLRMAQDELRHTETCGRVVEALGGRAVCPAKLEVAPLALHAGCSPEERALRNVLYTTCLSEMNAISRFVDNLDTIRSPYIRDMTRALLSDEILHGQFGFHYLAAWRPWLDAHPDVVGSLDRYLIHAFASLEVALGSMPDAHNLFSDDEVALGLMQPGKAREIFYATVEGAIVPGLEQLGLAAETAWKRRRFLSDEDSPAVLADLA